MNVRGRRWAPFAVLAVVVALFPAAVEPQTVNLGIFAGIFAIAALGLQMMMGFAGQANLGQAGFFAVGAYTSAVLVTRLNWGGLAAGLAALLLTIGFGYLVGLPLLRLKGYYLALATFGFGIIVAVLANEWSLLGHTTGIFGIPKLRILGYSFAGETPFFYLVWSMALVGVILARNLVGGRVGRALAALHDSEIAAETLGVDTFWTRLQVLMIAAATGSVAGSLYAHWVSVINPAAASFILSIEFIAIAVVGGLTSVWGPIIGAVFIEALNEGLQVNLGRFMGGSTGEVQLIVFGLILAAVLVFMPDGFAGLASRLMRRFHSPAREAPCSVTAAGDAPSDDRTDGTGSPTRQAVRGRQSASAETVLLDVSAVSRRFGGVHAVADVDLQVRPGEIVALIGPNGAGKTTLFNMISGVIPPTRGTITIAGERVDGARPHRIAQLGAARTFQNLEIFGSLSVLDNVKVGRHLRSRKGVLAGASYLPARIEERRIHADACRFVDVVGLADVAERPAVDLPFGRQRLVELARALACEPDLLLLDEPMAGLSAGERTELSDLLRQQRNSGMGILLVEHDMHAVMALADRVVVLDNGHRIAMGPPSEVQNAPAVIEAYLGVDLDFADLRRGP